MAAGGPTRPTPADMHLAAAPSLAILVMTIRDAALRVCASDAGDTTIPLLSQGGARPREIASVRVAVVGLPHGVPLAPP